MDSVHPTGQPGDSHRVKVGTRFGRDELPTKPPRLLLRRPKFKRNRHKMTKVAFFRYCYYEPAFKFFVEQVLDAVYLPLPGATQRTTDLGVRYSSDFVCTPFKHMMGDFIEALEAGADVLIQFGGPCRLGYYGEVQEALLREAGYDFTMLNFSAGIEQGYIGFSKEVLRVVNPDIPVPHGVKQLLATALLVSKLDDARDFYLANAAFERERGAFDRAWADFALAIGCARDAHEINGAYRDGMAAMRAIPLDKPTDPIRIGIVGEMFTAIDERSNLDLDRRLMAQGEGVALYRMLNLSNEIFRFHEANQRKSVSEYMTYYMGPTSTLTIVAAKRYAEQGFDGIIHAKSAGCTPEIDCEPVLARISEDYGVPVLYLTYDTQTSPTGLDTRLEAFYDMVAMRRRARGKADL